VSIPGRTLLVFQCFRPLGYIGPRMPLAAGCRSLKRPILAICAGETASVRRLRSSRGRSRSDRSRVDLSRTDTADLNEEVRSQVGRFAGDLRSLLRSSQMDAAAGGPSPRGLASNISWPSAAPKHRKPSKYLHKPRDSSSCFTPTSYLYHDLPRGTVF
jgi:hypothetical protein